MSKIDHFLERFFHPQSVAIVGATNNPFKMNFRLNQNLVDLNFQGKIYPVNPDGLVKSRASFTRPLRAHAHNRGKIGWKLFSFGPKPSQNAL